MSSEYGTTKGMLARLTFHPAYLDGHMELEVFRVDHGEEVPGDYEEDGDIWRVELDVPAGETPQAIRAAFDEVREKLGEIGLQPWDDDWTREGEYALVNDVKPLKGQ